MLDQAWIVRVYFRRKIRELHLSAVLTDLVKGKKNLFRAMRYWSEIYSSISCEILLSIFDDVAQSRIISCGIDRNALGALRYRKLAVPLRDRLTGEILDIKFFPPQPS
jgi:hypothetical protein